jgi:hypothetical protein
VTEYAIRPGRAFDLAYVVDTWVKSDRTDETISQATSRVRQALALPDTELRVAHLPDDPDAIVGWAALAPGRVLYAYVRRELRGRGIAKTLTAKGSDALA